MVKLLSLCFLCLSVFAEKVELFYLPGCYWCREVDKVIDEMHVHSKIEFHDISKDRNARIRLVTVGGKPQVPCLFVDNKPMYESREIIDWLKTRWK